MKDSASNEQSQCKTGMRDSKSLSDAGKSYEEKNMGNHSGVGEADDRVFISTKVKITKQKRSTIQFHGWNYLLTNLI